MLKRTDLEERLAFQKRLEEFIENDDNEKSKLPHKIGIATSTFTRAANYGIIPRTATLMRIADYFQTSIEYLLCKTDDTYFISSNENKSFYERLIELKDFNGIKTNYKLADKLHLSRQVINGWKNKNYYPSLEILELLADFFEVSIDYLLGRTDDKQN